MYYHIIGIFVFMLVNMLCISCCLSLYFCCLSLHYCRTLHMSPLLGTLGRETLFVFMSNKVF